MIKQVICTAVLLFPAFDADAEILLKDYKKAKDEQTQTLLKVYLAGALSGISWVNSELIHIGKAPLFCDPPKLTITNEQAEDIMMRESEKISNPDDFPVPLLLMKGLEDTFPCNK